MTTRIALVLLVLAVVGLGIWYWTDTKKTTNTVTTNTNAAAYNPDIDPTNFVAVIDNPYFTLTPGTTYTYEGRTDEGLEKIEVTVTETTRTILGIPAREVHDQVWFDDTLIEDTRDWYAQDRDGNVWYLGEAVDNYEDGVLKDHAGSWEAGVDGAKPGIVMETDPQVGDEYRQEYFAGEAEDMGTVVALDAAVTVPHGSFTNCLQTRDWSRIEAMANEYKYYCTDVGFNVLETTVADPTERTELVTVVAPAV